MYISIFADALLTALIIFLIYSAIKQKINNYSLILIILIIISHITNIYFKYFNNNSMVEIIDIIRFIITMLLAYNVLIKNKNKK